MGGSSPALTPDLLCDCCASLCPKHCRGGVLTTSSASTEAQETGRTPALTLETCLSCGRSLWGWESLRDKRESHLPNRFPSKAPPPPAPANLAWEHGMGHLHLAFPGRHLCPHFPQQLWGEGALGEVHWSLYWVPSPTSPQPSAFTQCWFYKKMGKFFFTNKGSLHRN